MSFSDDMKPDVALAQIRTELVENSNMDRLCEVLIAHERDGLVYVHDFAEALEDCDVLARTTLLRKIFVHLHTSEENPETLNRYILVSAVKTGEASTMRAKIFQSQNRKKSYPDLEKKIRNSIPPKKHMQTDDNESPTEALKNISLQIMGSGKYDELAASLVMMDTEKSGYVSAPVFADTLEDYSIHVRMVVITAIFNHFNGKMVQGILSMKRETLLNTVVELAEKSMDVDDDGEDTENKETLLKFDPSLTKSPSDELSGVNGLKEIAKELDKNNTMSKLEEALGIFKNPKGLISVQDFADSLEDCDCHCRTLLIRRIFREIFNATKDDHGILSVNKQALLITIKAQVNSRTSDSQSRHSAVFTHSSGNSKSMPRRNSNPEKFDDEEEGWKAGGSFEPMQNLL